MNAKPSIAVLMGGMSNEREVSLSTGKAVLKALQESGYNAWGVDADKKLPEILAAKKPDLAFNALHGRYGEDGCVAGLLEIMGIPYTHSGVLASSVAMNKEVSKLFFRKASIPCAESFVISAGELLRKGSPLPAPYVIKPVSEGSSVGVHIITGGNNSLGEILKGWSYGEIMVEEFLEGREISVAVLENPEPKALGVIEIRPKTSFYNYESKYTDGRAEHLMPAPLPPEIYREAMSLAEKAHNAIGCSGVSRSDFRYNEKKSSLHILEINTHPGMTPLSLTPEIAAHSGISFPALVDAIVKKARLYNN